MAYFRCSLGGGSGNGAVITVTYGAEFYNQTLVATNGTDTVSVIASSSGTADIAVPSEGSWVISCTIGADTYTSDPVLVELSYEATITAIPDGSTVLPTDDVETWLECAGITDKAYTTLAEVLADTDTYTTLLGDSNACDYMVRSTTWSTDIVADADAMRLLGMYDYACDALLSDSTWASAIANSTYFESVLDVSVPKMTSNTAPSGVASASHSYSGYAPYNAFDQKNTYNTSGSGWLGKQNNDWCQYAFTSPVVIRKVILDATGYGTTNSDMTISGSNDGINFTDIQTYSSVPKAKNAYVLNNSTAYTYYRVKVSIFTTVGYGLRFQFYGRHEAQTDIIRSAPSDTIYYLDNGSPVTLCTTDTDGIGSVDWSTLPTGDITLYSSIAKNPTDLTADYSKTIKVTKNKVEGYLMPDNTLYWWGYNVGLDDNFTGVTGSNISRKAYTSNTNNVYVSCSSSQFCSLGTGEMQTASKVHAIGYGTQGSNYNCRIAYASSKTANLSSGTGFSASTWTDAHKLPATIGHLVIDEAISGDYYIVWLPVRCESTLNALWLE